MNPSALFIARPVTTILLMLGDENVRAGQQETNEPWKKARSL